MPNNFDYLNQVLVELESLMLYKSEEDQLKLNKENHLQTPEDPENLAKSTKIQGELDNSVAQVMKKYEENDDDREDDDEDLYLINEMDLVDETPKITLFILLKD